ncbi:hypothetical protein G6F65_016381 [Rhizopus arrhizus]|nr:hypothetical protein G6F65_016381 [Rhizopus arrhizus]
MISIRATQKVGKEKPTMLPAMIILEKRLSGYRPATRPSGRPMMTASSRALIANEAVAQIAVQRPVQKAQVLLPQGLVQTQFRDDAGAVHLVDVLADQDVHGVADGVQAHEDDQRHQEHNHDGLRHAA